MREKGFGIWQSWSWAEAGKEIFSIAAGIFALGFKSEDKLAIIGDNRPHLYWAMTASQILGGVPVPMYQDAVAKEMQFVLEHAEVRFAIVEDQEQVDKLIEIKENLPKLEKIIFTDSRGMRHYNEPYLTDIKNVQEKGLKFLEKKPDFIHQSIFEGNRDDAAIILYTSGTTGIPKGVILSHSNLLTTGRNASELDGLRYTDNILSYLPMAWVGDNIFSFAQSYTTGYCVNCPESSDTVMQDLKEISPTYFFAPPRIFENILTQVHIRIEDASLLNRWIFDKFMAIAKKVGANILDGKKVDLKDRISYFIGNILLYAPLKNELGFSNIRISYTAGEAIGPDIFSFFRALGINIKQLYGSTEASVFICMHKNGDVKADTVGPPAKDVDLKILDDGEVLFRSPGVFKMYFRDKAATKKTKEANGWVHTGDAGIFDADGHLKIIDRAKDVGKLQDGTMFAPKYIENKLKFFPFIKEAVAFGQDREFTAVFINIDLEAVGNWAERRGIAYSGYTDLASQNEVYELIANCVGKTNLDLASDPELAGSQIKRFLILHKELDADDGELTRTRKVRRSYIYDKYELLVKALYSDSNHCDVEAEVTFENGRKGTIRADLQIRDAKIASQTPVEATK